MKWWTVKPVYGIGNGLATIIMLLGRRFQGHDANTTTGNSTSMLSFSNKYGTKASKTIILQSAGI